MSDHVDFYEHGAGSRKVCCILEEFKVPSSSTSYSLIPKEEFSHFPVIVITIADTLHDTTMDNPDIVAIKGLRSGFKAKREKTM